MYFVPDETKVCGFYECQECGMRFLDVRIVPYMVCPYCGEEVDMELGPDEELPENMETAKLLQVLEEEDIQRMDALLSLALTGGEFEWI